MATATSLVFIATAVLALSSESWRGKAAWSLVFAGWMTAAYCAAA